MGIIIMLISHMKKLRLSKLKLLAQSQTEWGDRAKT